MKGQFVGLDNTADNMYDAAYGFFHVINCFDVEIDGARTLPRVYDRDGTANDSPAGTYGIGGSFTLFLKLKNITADGAAQHWGVMGTNTMKNMYIEHCNLSHKILFSIIKRSHEINVQLHQQYPRSLHEMTRTINHLEWFLENPPNLLNLAML